MALPRDDNSDLARSLISPDAVYGPRASNLSSQRSSVVMRATSGGATGGEGAKGEKGNKYDAGIGGVWGVYGEFEWIF